MRRHLTDWEKFMTLNAVTETKKQGAQTGHEGVNEHSAKKLLNNPLNSEGLSLDEQADKLEWSKAKLKQAKYIEKNGTEDMKEKLKSGEFTIGSAYKELKPPKKKAEEEIDIEDAINKLAKRTSKTVTTKYGILYWKQFKDAINNIKL